MAVAAEAEAFYAQALGEEPAATGLRFVVGDPGRPGMSVVVAALRPRPPLTDPWGREVSFE